MIVDRQPRRPSRRQPARGLVLLLALGLTLLTGRAAASDIEARAAFSSGLKLAEAGDVAGAIGRFDRVLGLDPAFPGARRNRGLLRARAGDWPGAIEDLQAALVAEPGHAPTLLALAQAMVRTDRPEAAENAVRQALLVAPDDPAAWRLLAAALLAQGQAEAAARAATAALRFDAADVAAWRLLAQAEAAAGHHAAAIDAAEAACRLAPPAADDLWRLGHLYLLAGLPADAARCHAAAAAAAPHDAATPDRLHQTAAALLAGGEADAAAPLVSQFIALEAATARGDRLQAELARARGDLAAATGHARDAVRRDPADPQAHLLLGRLLLDGGDPAGALDQASLARAFPAARVAALHLETDAHLRQGAWAAALESLDRLAAADPGRDYSVLRQRLLPLAQR